MVWLKLKRPFINNLDKIQVRILPEIDLSKRKYFSHNTIYFLGSIHHMGHDRVLDKFVYGTFLLNDDNTYVVGDQYPDADCHRYDSIFNEHELEYYVDDNTEINCNFCSKKVLISDKKCWWCGVSII